MKVLQMFLHCVPRVKLSKNEDKMMVLKSFNSVLKKYGKWFLKMCGSPAAAGNTDSEIVTLSW